MAVLILASTSGKNGLILDSEVGCRPGRLVWDPALSASSYVLEGDSSTGSSSLSLFLVSDSTWCWGCVPSVHKL